MPVRALLETPAGWRVDRPDETPRRSPCCACRTHRLSAPRRRSRRRLHTNPPGLLGPIGTFAERTPRHLPDPTRSSAFARTAVPLTPPLPTRAAPPSSDTRFGAPCAAACAVLSGRTLESLRSRE